MKGAIYEDVENYKVVDLELDPCGPDDIIVKNLYAGICGSDLETFRHGGASRGIKKGDELGHEVVSEVIDVGKNVKDIQIGDHLWPQYGCAKRDMSRSRTVGAFSEYIHFPRYEKGYSAVVIDKEIPLKTAVLLEPFIVGTKGVLPAEPGPGKTAVVFGAGIIGMSASIMLKWYGCDNVMIADVSEKRLKNAETFGLLTCDLAKENLEEKAKAAFGTENGRFGEKCGADIYVDCIGTAGGDDPFITVHHFEHLAKRKAMLCVIGVHHQEVPLSLEMVCYQDLIIRGSGSTSPQEASKDILAMMKSGKYDLESLVTHEYPLSEINDACRMAGNSKEAQKVVIKFD